MQVSPARLVSWFASPPPHAMFLNDNSCKSNCSGHGDCYNGTCFCEVEYSGGTCNDPNFKFYVSFSTVYYMICVVSFIQLMLCINSEIARQKPRNIRRAFRISTQKALYFFICLGTAIRGFYFSSPANSHIRWAESLMSAYYPILMSGCGLVVCFWAEVFHLDISVERSRFLSKSFTGFVLFNVVTYSLLVAEWVLFAFADPSDSDKGLFLSVFNSIYAFLMFVVVVAFLIYGVEVYFKVRGAFTQEGNCYDSSLSSADISQLQQSRLGLISQAVLLLITILFMISEVFGSLWKDKVPVLSRNYHQVMFRVVEFGVALWFPCVLWNCIEPEKLWILNPRKILKRDHNGAIYQIDEHRRPSKLMLNGAVCKSGLAESELLVGDGKTAVGVNNNGFLGSSKAAAMNVPECFICYETVESKPEAGPLIQPCACRGDVSAVHHACLIRWLMEAYSSPSASVHCKVCGTPYRVEHSSELICLPAGLTIVHWMKTAAIFTMMLVTLTGSCLMVRMFSQLYVKTISVGAAILVEYICLRLLGFNLIAAYHRAKFSAIKIIGRKITSSGGVGGGTSAVNSSSTSSANHYHCSPVITTQESHVSGINRPGTSGLPSKAHLLLLQQERAEVHHSCASPDFSDDDDCFECIAAQKGICRTEAVPPPLQSLSESVHQTEQQICSSMTCDHQSSGDTRQ